MLVALLLIAGYLALFLAVAAPPIAFARRRRERATIRHFLVAALLCGVLSGGVAASSRLLVDRCRDQGNTQCHDYGASGLQFVLIAAFAGTAAIRTWTLITD